MRRVLETGEPWTAENTPVEFEREPGKMSRGYFTFSVTRIEIDGEPGLLSEVQETTAQIEAQQQATRELETTRLLLQASRTLTERVELQHVLSKLAEVLLSSTSHKRSFVFSWDEDTHAAHASCVGRVSGVPVRSDVRVRRRERSHEAGDPTDGRRRSSTSTLSPKRSADALLAAQQSHVLVVVPVVWQDRLVGLIGVDDPGERREFSQREIDIVEGIAAQAATAIENARLFEERAEALRALAARRTATSGRRTAT